MKIKLLSKVPFTIKELSIEPASIAPRLHMSNDAYAYNKILFLPDERKSYIWYIRNFMPYLNAWSDITHSDYTYIDDPVLYLRHPFDHNYSHFTLNCLHACLLAQENGIFHGNLKIATPSYIYFQKQLLKMLNVNQDQIINLDNGHLYKFKTVFYSDSLLGYAFNHPEYVALYERFGEKYNNLGNKNIYITRKSNSRRAAINEAQVIEFFTNKKFEIADFDELPVSEQLKLVNSAKIICASHGASGANLVYRRKDSFKFIEIFSENRVTPFHTQILTNKNCEYTGIINQATEKNDKNNKTFNDSPYVVDLELLEIAIKNLSHKFMPNQCINSGIQENNLIANILKDYCPEMKAYMDCISFSQSGEHKKAIEVMSKYDYKRFHSCMREFYLNLLLLNGDHENYKKLNAYTCQNWMPELAHVIMNHNLKIDNKSFFNKRPSFIKDNDKKLLEVFLSFKEKALSRPNTIPLSWHNTFFHLDPQEKELKHGQSYSKSIVITLENQGISLFDPASQLYINNISSDGVCSFSKEKFIFPIIQHNEWNFSIIINNCYLSAHKNGIFTLAAKAREWERFFMPIGKLIKKAPVQAP